MPLSPEQVITGHRTALALVREQVLAFASAAWKAQGSYRDADIDRLVSLIVPRVQAGQIKVASLTSAYIASISTLQTGRPIAAVPVARDIILDARGVPAADVYRRPGAEVHRALARGNTFTEAVAAGMVRLGELVVMDMQMSQVRQASMSYQASGIGRFRRVLSGSTKTCDLCMDLAQEVYMSDQLLPVHDGCGCTTAPLADGEALPPRPESQPTEESAPRVEVREHGEYGPVLTRADDGFTGPAAIDAGRSVEQLQTTLASLERSAQHFNSEGTQARIVQLRHEIASRG